MENIFWRPLIIDGEQLPYIINSRGDVISLKHKKIMISFESKSGYLRIGIKHPHGKQKKYFVHRLVGMVFVDGYNKNLTINHINGIKKDNYYKNLEWVTIQDNERHAVETGLKAKGSRHGSHKYNENSIHMVCRLLEQHCTYGYIKEKTGVELKVIYDIKNKKSWLHISSKYKIPETLYSKYSKYKQEIYEMFDNGHKTKSIMSHFEIYDVSFKNMISRLRYFYNLKKVQRLSLGSEMSNRSTTVSDDGG